MVHGSRQEKPRQTRDQVSGVLLFQPLSSPIDDMAVFNPTWASGFTGKAGQAVIQMPPSFICHGRFIQHGPDQFNPSPGAFEFKSCHKIGRAGGVAKSTVHTSGD